MPQGIVMIRRTRACMEKQTFEYVNKFAFKNAKVIGKRKRNQSFILTLFLRNKNKAIYPRIICRNNTCNVEAICIGDVINGEGYIRAYNEVLEDLSIKKHQYFVADNVSLSKDLMTEIFGKKGTFFGESRFDIMLSGKTMKVKEGCDYSYITLVTDISVAGRKPSYVTLMKPNNVTKPKINDMIAIAVSLKTPKVTKGGQTQYLENLYVSDLVIV